MFSSTHELLKKLSKKKNEVKRRLLVTLGKEIQGDSIISVNENREAYK